MKKVIHFLLLCLLLLVTASCRTTKQLVPVESRASTETKYRTIVQRDTVRDSVILKQTLFRHDSTIIQMKGDTFYVDRWHIIDNGTYSQNKTQRGGIRVDTLYMNRTDSVHVPVPVEKQLSKWQKAMMSIGEYTLVILVAVLLLVLAVIINNTINKNHKPRSNI